MAGVFSLQVGIVAELLNQKCPALALCCGDAHGNIPSE
jgi:hypothetical protein